MKKDKSIKDNRKKQKKCQYLQKYESGQTHYKMISCNIWLPVVIHRSKTRNNALDVF